MYTYLWPHSQKVYPQKRPPTTHTHTAHTHLLTLTQSIHHSHTHPLPTLTHPPTTYTHTVCTTPLTHSPTLTQSTPLTQSHYPYLHSSSSRGRSPVGLFATRSRQSWLSTKTTEDHSIPSLSYSSCSSLKMCLLKYCCSCSLAKLMQNCSKEFFWNTSKPNMSSTPIEYPYEWVGKGGYISKHKQLQWSQRRLNYSALYK